MARIYAAVRYFVLLLFWQTPSPAPSRTKKPRPKRLDPDGKNEFYFRETILDQLDEYFYYAKRMKKGDREAYNLYSKIGAHILPKTASVSTKLEPWWKTNRPSFGAVAFGAWATREEERKEYFLPAFIYFTKYERPPSEIQPTGRGDVYRVTAYWDRRGDAKLKRGVPTEFAVSIANDGTVNALKIKRTEYHRIQHKRGGASEIPRTTWDFPSWFKGWADEHNKRVDEFLAQTFIISANLYAGANSSMIRVAARKGGISAVFGVDVVRLPYFFKDRDVSADATGKRKKVFHIVRAHKRITAGGSESWVRTHFRGERKFEWNGYRISISVPGVHHGDLTEFDAGVIDIEHPDSFENLDDMMDARDVGDELSRHIDKGGRTKAWVNRPKPHRRAA